jgi:hypothetical protein
MLSISDSSISDFSIGLLSFFLVLIDLPSFFLVLIDLPSFFLALIEIVSLLLALFAITTIPRQPLHHLLEQGIILIFLCTGRT